MVAKSGTYWGGVWRLAPCLVLLMEEVDERWPDRSKVSDGSIGDTRHQAARSDHNPDGSGDVLAVDITEDHKHGPDLKRFCADLITRRDPRVKYLIYERQIVKSYVDSKGRPAWVPQPYTLANPHEHHLHVSVHDHTRHDTSTWFPTASTPEVPEEEDEDMAYLLITAPNRPTTLIVGDRSFAKLRDTDSVNNLKAAGVKVAPLTTADYDAIERAMAATEVRLVEA